MPSRYVTGYLAHESTGQGKMVVRGRDAHAWAESWIEGIGWVTVEATPPSGLPSAMQPVSSFVLALEWLEDCWAQAMAWFSSLSWMQLLGRSAMAAVACGILIRFGRKALQWRWRRKRPAGSAAALYSAPDETLRASALRFEELLRRVGAPCPRHRTWQEHLTALADPPLNSRLDLEQAEGFIRQYNAARFGAPNDSTATRELQAVLDELESAAHGQRTTD